MSMTIGTEVLKRLIKLQQLTIKTTEDNDDIIKKVTHNLAMESVIELIERYESGEITQDILEQLK